MSEMSVDVGLNIDAGEYLQTMGQAVAITKQYVNVADGLNGAVASANKGFVALTNRMTGFNKTSTVAVEAAAAYQKQMSGIEAKAAITGKNFSSLEKTTKSLARTFPIGMGQAVDVVESLMKAGVKTEREISSLGKSFVKLGAATGTSAAAIGSDMLQLNKTMGNGAGQFDALADSVVGATAKLGGTVPSVIAFSKALAPVASTVGISQTAVMGLSTAMSSLGEDGYRAANTFNKVLLDMNTSIRDGGPGLKSYADLMGTTSEKLKEMFKTNPTEVLNQFAEAVAKQGPNISRQMESIGFDSVRDTRSLTALARAGGSRNAINEAVASYGSGKTAEAAGVTMGGVIDQSELLKESMSQVVVNVGKPMLGIAKTQLQIATDVSNTMASITESKPGQAILGGTGVAGAAGGVASQVMLAGGMLAMGKMMFGNLSGFGAGRAFAMQGEALPKEAGAMPKAGYAAGSAAAALRPGSPLVPMAGTAGRMAQTAARFTASGLAKINNAVNTNYIAQQTGMSPVGQTVAGQAALANIQKGIADGARAAITGNVQGVKDAGNLMKAGRGDLSTLGKQMGATPLRVSGGEMLRSAGTAVAGSGQLIAGAGMRAGAVGMAGASALGLTPALLGIAAAAGVGYTGYKMYKGQQENLSAVRASSSDMYSSYNSFAESIGKSGKGLAAFSAQVDLNTNVMSDQNATIKEALKLTDAEYLQSREAGYESRFKLQGNDMSSESITAQIQSVLGPSATPDLVARAMSDVANQANNKTTLDEVATNLEGFFGPRSQGGGELDYEALLQTVGNNKGFVSSVGEFIQQKDPTGGILGSVLPTALLTNPVTAGLLAGQSNDVQTNLATQMSTSAMQTATELGSTYGGTAKISGRDIKATDAQAISEAKKIYDAALGKSLTEQKVAAEAIRSITGMTEEQANDSGLSTGTMGPAALKFNNTFESVMNQLAEYTGEGGGNAAGLNYQALVKSGYDFNKNDLSLFGTEAPESEKEARKLASQFDRLTGASSKLTESMYGAEKAARDYHTTTSDLTNNEMKGMTAASKAQREYDLTSADDKRYAAGQAYADEASGSKDANGKKITSTMAMFSLQLAEAIAPADTNKQRGLSTAVQLQQRENSLKYAGKPQAVQVLDAIRVGQAAQQMPMTSNSNLNEVIQNARSLGVQSQVSSIDTIAGLNRAGGAMRAQERTLGRQTGVQIGIIRRDAAINQEYAQEDFTRTKKYGKQDFDTSVFRAKRDQGTTVYRAEEDFVRSSNNSQEAYNRSRENAEKDYTRQAERSQKEFNKQRKYSIDDFEIGRVRATRDYNLQVSRAGRDFHLSETRALDDFNKSQSRSLVDYNRGRTRMTEDFNKQITRMVEDSAKSMYDPYKRIAAQMVMDAGQLVTNLKDQATALTKQTSNLAEARSLGLKDETIKALGLADATNGQQLSRLLSDMKGNEGFAQSLNDSVALKAAAATELATDSGSTAYARALADFNTALERSDEDFAMSMSRAIDDFSLQTARGLTDFTTGMSDSKADFKTAMADSSEDFTKQLARTDDAFLTQMKAGLEEYTIGVERMALENNIARALAQKEHDIQMANGKADFAKALGDMQTDYDKNLLRSEKAFNLSMTRMKAQVEKTIGDISAQMGASILSMHESFVALLQQSPEDPAESAKAAKALLQSLGIDREYWGDEIDAAMALIDAAIARRGNPSIREAERGTGSPPITTPEDSSPNAHQAYKPLPPPPPPPRVYSWKDFFVEDWGKAETWTGIGGQLMAGISKGIADYGFNFVGLFGGFLEGVKSFFGVKSPSTVFAEIGKNLVEGLKNGLTETIDGVWEIITDPISKLNIEEKVESAFNSAKTWLGTLGTKIEGWVGSAWDWIKSPLGSGFNLKETVETAFSTAKAWLAGLADSGPDSVKTWVGNAWSKITANIPSITDVINTVKAAFGLGPDSGGGGIAQWIQGLKDDSAEGKDTVAGWIGDAWGRILENIPGLETVKNGFKEMGTGIVEIINALISSWNSLRVTIPIPEWAKALPFGPQSGKDFLDFGVKYKAPIEWNLAEGGIATRQMRALIGEAGYPEAVIPLNERGAAVLAATMGRYLDNNVAKGSQSMANSTRVVNNYSSSYDYRTEYNGAITVQAQDPEELAMRLAARKKIQRLAQPIGAGR